MAICQQMRERMLGLIDGGVAVAEVARRFAVCRATLFSLLRRRRELGTARRKVRAYPSRLDGRGAEIAALYAAHPDLTLAEAVDRLVLGVCPSILCRHLKRVGLTRKKSR